MASKPIARPASAPKQGRVHNWIMALFLVMLVAGLAGLAWLLAPNLRQAIPLAAGGAGLSLDQRMIRIADRLQCPICEGQSVAFSNSQLAAEMRRLILDKLQDGEDEAQIMQYFVDRYGVKILREPPKQGLNIWLWITPMLGLVAGLAGLLWKLRLPAAAEPAGEDDELGKGQLDHDLALDPEVQELLAQYDKDLLT